MVLSFLFVLIFLHCAFVVNYSSASVKLFPLQTTLGVDSFPQYGLKVWSSDFHISPVADIKNLMVLFGVQVIDKSLSGHCHLTGTCEKDLRVINKANGISLGDCPNRLIQEFFDFYKSDYEMKSVDAILCLHAMSMCELFMPFNKTLIAIASTRSPLLCEALIVSLFQLIYHSGMKLEGIQPTAGRSGIEIYSGSRGSQETSLLPTTNTIR